MKKQSLFYRSFRLFLFWVCGNLPLCFSALSIAIGWKIAAGVILGILFLIFQFLHPHTLANDKKLASLAHGCDMLRTSAIWFCLEIGTELFLSFYAKPHWIIHLVNLGVFALLCWLTMFLGLLHIALHSRQVKLLWHVGLFFFWWVPILNLVFIVHIYRTAKRECIIECAKAECNAVRKESEICKTKYPILMVHGIFFRDWQKFNYWGRIPAELMRNGAVIFYGKQQSAQAVSNSARELAVQIRAVCNATGAEKVNLIAHSKGGLDCICAMQEYGAAQYVASLTTINTPHYGVAFVDELLRKLPNGLIRWVGKRYNRIFTRLGDANPDFLSGVRDLTAERCRQFQASHPLQPNVRYLAVMSKMHSAFSAPFPLWLGYLLNKKRGDENDGLVPVASAKLAHAPFVMVPETKRRGVSHGDMIDLNRENIPGFDVREWYVKLVQQLKANGL